MTATTLAQPLLIPIRRRISAFCLSAIIAISTVTPAQMIDSLDQVMIDSALTLLKLHPDELGFDKAWVKDDTFKLAVVQHYLDNPYSFPQYVDETQSSVDSFSR